MTNKDYSLLCNLDRLKQLIRNARKSGKATIAATYEAYYNKIISDKNVLKTLKDNNYKAEI